MNCIIIDDEPLAHKVIKKYCDSLTFLRIVDSFHSAIEAIGYLNENDIDLIFLDINMPKLKGLDFLRTLQHPPMVIITSAYQEYALESYELDVIDYLLKPFSFERFIKSTNKAQTQQKLRTESQENTSYKTPPTNIVRNDSTKESIFIKGDKKTHQVNFDDILFLESYGSYIKIHVNDEVIITLDRLKNYENLLPKSQFVRIHKSYIVPIKKIQTIEGNRIKVSGNELPIGTVYKHNLDSILK